MFRGSLDVLTSETQVTGNDAAGYLFAQPAACTRQAGSNRAGGDTHGLGGFFVGYPLDAALLDEALLVGFQIPKRRLRIE
jgi:hypothetical protein